MLIQKKHYEPLYASSVHIEKKEYILGVHPLHNSKRLFASYQPLVNFLNRYLKDEKIILETSKNYARYNEKIAQRHFDFLLPNPYQTLQAQAYGYKVFGKMGNDHQFKGIILLRKDSPIKKIEDLKGKKISYPAATALAATMMPQWLLYENGIDINKDLINLYVGSQESSIMNVYLKKTDAAATWLLPWEALKIKRPEIAKMLTLKWETPYLINNSLMARQDVPPQLVDRVSRMLTGLHTFKEGQTILKEIAINRFEEANDQDYKIVKTFIDQFESKVRKVGFTHGN